MKKRKHEGEGRPRKHKKIRKVQQHYSSGSESDASPKNDEFDPVDLADSDEDSGEDVKGFEENIHSDAGEEPPTASSTQRAPISSASSGTDSVADSDLDSEASLVSNPNRVHVSKRNDPTAFASSISAILSSKLTSTKRADPVLARSTTAAQANTDIASAKLDAQARQKLREDKKAALDKGRVKDVLLGTDAPDKMDEGEEMGDGEKVKEIQELEKRLRKTAQRGVVKLFNAVRQAQVRAEEAAKEKGTIGRGRREEKVGEMSKKGFLEMVAGGGGGGNKKPAEVNIQEA